MNAWIGLCQFDDRFPDELAKLGYSVDIIEPDFYLGDDYVQPDLVLTAPRKNHSLLLDFKSVMVKESQHDRYQRAIDDPEQLVLKSVVTGVAPGNIEAGFTYSSFQNLAEIHDLSDVPLTTVQFDAHIGSGNLRIEVVGTEKFDDPDLDDIFPVTVSYDQDIPTDYYPYDAEDEDIEQFCIYMLNATVELANESGGDPFNVDELLERSHKLWGSMSESKQKELRTLAEKFLTKYNQKGLDKHLRKVQKDDQAAWFHKSKSLQALRNKADEFIEDLKDDLLQRSITDY